MKLIIPLFILLNIQYSFAQDCYLTFHDEGVKSFEASKFEKAINQFKAAKICDDLPEDNDVEEWINKSQNGYIDAIKKAQNKAELALARANSLFWANQSKQALTDGDLIPAFRLMERAYEEDQNPTTQELIINFKEEYGVLFENRRSYKMLKCLSGRCIGHSDEDKIHLYNRTTGETIRTLQKDGEDELVKSVAYNKNVENIATISNTGEASVWDAKGNLIKTLKGKIQMIEFSEDGQYLLSISDDRRVHIHNPSGKHLMSVSEFKDDLAKIATSKNNQYLLVVSKSGDCVIRDISNGQNIVVRNIGMGNILDASFSTNNRQVIFISEADKILLADIDLNEASKVEIIPVISKMPETIDKVIVSEDGKYVLVTLKIHGFGAVLYNQKGQVLLELSHQDLEWTIFQTPDEETLLIFRKADKIELRQLEKHSFRENILLEYKNKMRDLTKNEKLRFGIE